MRIGRRTAGLQIRTSSLPSGPLAIRCSNPPTCPLLRGGCPPPAADIALATCCGHRDTKHARTQRPASTASTDRLETRPAALSRGSTRAPCPNPHPRPTLTLPGCRAGLLGFTVPAEASSGALAAQRPLRGSTLLPLPGCCSQRAAGRSPLALPAPVATAPTGPRDRLAWQQTRCRPPDSLRRPAAPSAGDAIRRLVCCPTDAPFRPRRCS